MMVRMRVMVFDGADARSTHLCLAASVWLKCGCYFSHPKKVFFELCNSETASVFRLLAL